MKAHRPSSKLGLWMIVGYQHSITASLPAAKLSWATAARSCLSLSSVLFVDSPVSAKAYSSSNKPFSFKPGQEESRMG